MCNASHKSITHDYIIYTKSEHVVVDRNIGLWLVTTKYADSTNEREQFYLKQTCEFTGTEEQQYCFSELILVTNKQMSNALFAAEFQLLKHNKARIHAGIIFQ